MPAAFPRGFQALRAEVLARATNLASPFHGEHHWRCVATLGVALARVTPGADPELPPVFALFHDALRVNDDEDPEHGARGAALLRELHGTYIDLSEHDLELLAFGCTHHTSAQTIDHATLACCFDADRLTLWRVGIEPSRRYLSTDAAKLPEWIARGRQILAENPPWPTVDPIA